MQINSGYNIASQAINQGLNNMNQIAHSIAQSGTTKETSPVKDLIELKKESQHIKANMHVIKTLKEAEDFLIDIMA